MIVVKSLNKILEVTAKFYGNFWDSLVKLVFNH